MGIKDIHNIFYAHFFYDYVNEVKILNLKLFKMLKKFMGERIWLKL